MIPIYQEYVDPERGDCMRAVIANLLELPINQVPNFIEDLIEAYNKGLKDGYSCIPNKI